MDLYEEKEHVISSDEYSEDDDDDDALMNDAVRAQSNIKPHLGLNEKPKWRIEQKQKQLSSLIRRNKISIIYKNKSIKWLNSKKQRERYKGQIIRNDGKKLNRANVTSEEESRLTSNKELEGKEESSGDISIKIITPSEASKEEHKAPRPREPEDNKTKGNQNTGSSHSSQTENPDKRSRSCSPLTVENRVEHSEKRFKADSPLFYKKINEMFPNFDAIAKDHVEYITNNSLTATDEKIKSIFNEIKTLNDILHTKEIEWNRILHLKMVKEELYSRLSRKKYVLELNETLTKTRGENSLTDLKELELYLSENNSYSQQINSSSYSSIQQIIENRANMKAEDLERERSNTSRLHSLLVSRNMLPGVETSANNSCGNGDMRAKCNDAEHKASFEPYQDLGSRTLLNKGRQGEFKDVKSIIADFRQKHPDILARDTKSNRHFQFPHFIDHKTDYYSLRDSVDEIAARAMKTPFSQVFAIGNTIVITIQVFSLNSHYNVGIDDNYNKGNTKRNFEVCSPKNIQYPFCQECKIHESRFVCAGCGNQWYCSKKCQISAWDKHSEICTD